MKKIERTQYQAALVHGKVETGQQVYEELGWETLSDRRRWRCILQIHKIKNNMAPFRRYLL